MSNKEEALRARDVAEELMRKGNFTAARRFALEAKEMDASLEKVVSRMMFICNVHCAALEKSGDETDWYKILQVDQNADDDTIRKQYKNLALLVHPDKNKLPGAGSAFQTMGEAYELLSDEEKRRLYDMNRKPVSRRQPQQAPKPVSRRQPQQAPTKEGFRAKSLGKSFTIVVPKAKPSYLYRLRIPSDATNKYFPMKKTEFKINDPDRKRSWVVVYIPEGNDTRFATGWTKLRKEYPVAARDICIFTILNPGELLLTIQNPK